MLRCFPPPYVTLCPPSDLFTTANFDSLHTANTLQTDCCPAGRSSGPEAGGAWKLHRLAVVTASPVMAATPRCPLMPPCVTTSALLPTGRWPGLAWPSIAATASGPALHHALLQAAHKLAVLCLHLGTAGLQRRDGHIMQAAMAGCWQQGAGRRPLSSLPAHPECAYYACPLLPSSSPCAQPPGCARAERCRPGARPWGCGQGGMGSIQAWRRQGEDSCTGVACSSPCAQPPSPPVRASCPAARLLRGAARAGAQPACCSTGAGAQAGAGLVLQLLTAQQARWRAL